MAKIIHKTQVIEVKDGDSIIGACETLGVPFSCYVGTCGACKIKIIKGMQNLSVKTQEEIDMGLENNQRLACQCKIKKGEVEIDF